MKSITLAILFLVLSSCSNQTVLQKIITNEKPQIEADSLDLFELEFSIPFDGGINYSLKYPRHAAVDSDKNIYILDSRNNQNHIIKFDKNGKFLNKFARDGKLSRELELPQKIFAINSKLYIYQLFRKIKILDTNGEYVQKVSNIPLILGYWSLIKFNDTNFVVVKRIFDDILDLENEIFIVPYKNVEPNKNIEPKSIYRFEIDIKTFDKFSPLPTYSMNSKYEMFFAKTGEKYEITKIDLNGNELMTFGREYSRIKYSKESIDKYNEEIKSVIHIEGVRPLDGYPPIISSIFIDDRDLLWVTVGTRIFNSIGKKQIPKKIDVFTSNGKFLYTFDTNLLQYPTQYTSGRIFSFYNRNEKIGEQTIKVYKINYDKLIK